MPIFSSLLTKIRRFVKREESQKTTEVNDNNINEAIGVVEVLTSSPESSRVRSECLPPLTRQQGRSASVFRSPSGSGWCGVLDTRNPPEQYNTLSSTLGRDNPVGEELHGDRGDQSCDRLIPIGDCAASEAGNVVGDAYTGERSDPEGRTVTKSGLSERVPPIRRRPSACSNDADVLPICVSSTGAELHSRDVRTHREKRNSADMLSRPWQENGLREVCHGLTSEAQRKAFRQTNGSMDDIFEVTQTPLKCRTPCGSIVCSTTTVQRHREATRVEHTHLFLSEVCSPSTQKPEHKTLPKAQRSVQKAYGRISETTVEFRNETLNAKPTGGLSSTEIMRKTVEYIPDSTTVQQTQLFLNDDSEIPVFPARQKLTQKTHPGPKEPIQYDDILENTKEFQPNGGSDPSKAKKSNLVWDTPGDGSGARPKYVSNMRSIRTVESQKELSNKSNRTEGYSKLNAGMPQRGASVLTSP